MQALKSEEMSQLQLVEREEIDEEEDLFEAIDKLPQAIIYSYKSETQNSIPEVLKMKIKGFSNDVIGLSNTSLVAQAILEYTMTMEVAGNVKERYSQLDEDAKVNLVNLGDELLDFDMKFNNIIAIHDMLCKSKDNMKVASAFKLTEDELQKNELVYYCIKRRLENMAKRESNPKKSKKSKNDGGDEKD